MNLFTKQTPPPLTYDQHVDRYESTRVNPILSSDYVAHEAAIRDTGLSLVRFEQKNKIDVARQVIRTERDLQGKISTFRKVVESFEALNSQTDWLIDGLTSGKIQPDQISHYCSQIDNCTSELKIGKAVLSKLEASLAEVLKQKATLPKQSLIDALKPSPLGSNREEFEKVLEFQNASFEPVAA